MKTFGYTFIRSLATLAVIGVTSSAVLSAPAARAATHRPVSCLACTVPQPTNAPYLIVTALHQSVYADGYRFFTNGLPVTLLAYAIDGGTKTFLGSAERTPTAQSGNTIAWDFGQAQDPCSSAVAPMQVEVDAWLIRGPLTTRASAMATAHRVYRFAPPLGISTELATATATVDCGVIIY